MFVHWLEQDSFDSEIPSLSVVEMNSSWMKDRLLKYIFFDANFLLHLYNICHMQVWKFHKSGDKLPDRDGESENMPAPPDINRKYSFGKCDTNTGSTQAYR